jgi:hypothetical protein
VLLLSEDRKVVLKAVPFGGKQERERERVSNVQTKKKDRFLLFVCVLLLKQRGLNIGANVKQWVTHAQQRVCGNYEETIRGKKERGEKGTITTLYADLVPPSSSAHRTLLKDLAIEAWERRKKGGTWACVGKRGRELNSFFISRLFGVDLV